MTDQHHTQPADAPTVTLTPPVPATDDPAAPGRRRDPAAEAQQRRLQLREVENERDALALERSDLRRQAIESLLTTTDDLRGDGSHAATLQHVGDLWDYFGATADQFYVNGALDREALADFIAEQTADRPHMAKAYVENVPPVNVVKQALDRQISPAPGSPWAHQPKSTWQAALQD